MRGRKTTLQIHVTETEFQELGRLTRSTSTAAGLVRRAEVILAVSQGQSFTQAAALVKMSYKHVRKWCKRFFGAPPEQRIQSLYDQPGRGRKPRFSPLGAPEHRQDSLRAS